MNGSKVWTMLTVRSQSYTPASTAYGALRQSDYAFLLTGRCDSSCSGLSRPQFMAGMLIGAGDRACLAPLEDVLHREVIRLSAKEEWHLYRGPAICQRLGHLALYEMIGPGAPCRECDGHGYKVNPETTTRTFCEDCAGRGKLPLAQKTRAEIIEVNEMNWSRTWSARYEQVHGILLNWWSEANRHLSKRWRATLADAATN